MSIRDAVSALGSVAFTYDDALYSNLEVCRVITKIHISKLNMLMDSGWTIMNTWIEPDAPMTSSCVLLSDISLRMGMGIMRLIVTVDIPVKLPDVVIPNLDADDPGDRPAMISGMKTEMGKIRAAAIAGYGPYATRGPGLKPPAELPTLCVIGLDIEVTTIERNGGMPLPHDQIISISISNGEWLDMEFPDQCHFIHTFGHIPSASMASLDGREVHSWKVDTSQSAVEEAYRILNCMSADFINVHNGFGFDLKTLACAGSMSVLVSDTFDERRLGNVGTGISWRLKNGSMFTDSLYTTDKKSRADFTSLSLDNMAKELGVPRKIDSDTMAIRPSEDYDMTNMARYNTRDSDMHVWVAKRTMMCERMCKLAGSSRSTMWDAIADNTGVMTFCLMQSVAIASDRVLDLGRNTTGADDRKFKGGYVLEPTPGCYQGIVMMDGNSLYGSLMSQLGIFIDRCTSAASLEELSSKMEMTLPLEAHEMEPDDVIWTDSIIMMMTEDAYIGIVRGGDTMLSEIIQSLISMRSSFKAVGDNVSAWAFKILLVSIYGAMGSKHGIMASKTCAEATTCAARFFLRRMIEAASNSGFKIIYGDTDSIFAWVNGETEEECYAMAKEMKLVIDQAMVGTPFANIMVDIKGNYKYGLFASRKMYAMTLWDDTEETKGMTPVKKDTLPIARFTAKTVLRMVNTSDSTLEKTVKIRDFLGKIFRLVSTGKVKPIDQVSQIKINCQPHYVYKSTSGVWVSVLVDEAGVISDVSPKWVIDRIRSSIANIILAANLPTTDAMMFSHSIHERVMVGAHASHRSSVPSSHFSSE